MNVWDLSGSWGRPFTSHPKVGLILYPHHHSENLVYIKILKLEILTYVSLHQKDPKIGDFNLG